VGVQAGVSQGNMLVLATVHIQFIKYPAGFSSTPLAASIQRRVEFKTACLAHQSITSTAPTYLSADIHPVSEHGPRHLRSSSYGTLAVPRTRTTLGDRSFAVTGPCVRNSLPDHRSPAMGSLGNI